MFVNFNILNQLGSPAINSNTFANRPAAGQTGRLFVSTDTFEIYRDNGTTWDLIGGPGSSTITGTGTATQVAYFTSSQAIGSSANLFWDNTSGFLGVATATPSARIEAVKTDGVGIYANFTTNAGSGSSTTALWAKNVTNSSGFAAVIEETTPNTTAGQYPLLIKHSLSSGTAGVGMGTGLHFQLPDDAGTFKTTQLTIETIDAAAATYKTRYRFNVQNNGSSTPVAYINATGLGIFTATPGAALDIHSTGIIAQLNSTSATANSLLAFQRSGSGLWRIGDNYGGGTNYFELFNTVLGINAMQVFAATNKTSWQATETYTTGQARANYFDYNLSVAAGGSFSSPNAITALGASLDLTLAGNATIPSGARSGLDAYNSIAFTGAGTLTHNQGTQIRAYSNVTAGWAFAGSATGTITHLAGLRALFPDNSGSAVNVTNNYALLLNDQTANTGTVTYTNRWGVYQEGASDLNYMAANLLVGNATNTGQKLQVTGRSYFSDNVGIGAQGINQYNLRIGLSITGATTAFSVVAEPVIQTDVTSSAVYFRTVASASASAFSINSIVHFQATRGSLGGASLSNQYGFFAAGTLIGATNNYAFYGDIAASTGRWNLYMNGTAANYLAGSLGIGSTAPSQKLSVFGGNLLVNNGASPDANSGIRIVAPISTTHFNWMIAAQQNVSNGFEITPSTAVGGTTFSTPAFVVTSGGSVGINTTIPSYRLHVNNAGGVPSTVAVAGFQNDGAVLEVNITSAATGSALIDLLARSGGAGNTSSSDFSFSTRNSGVIGERMRIKSTGQVRFIPLAADPAGAQAGDVYYNSGTNKLRLYDGTNWVDLN